MKFLFGFTITFISLYLCGAFVSNIWNPLEFHYAGKIFILFSSFVMGIACASDDDSDIDGYGHNYGVTNHDIQ